MSSLKDTKVLFASSEIAPFAKTGGLADVVGTLPHVLKDLGADIRVLMPYYGMVKQGKIPMTTVAENLEGHVGDMALAFDVKTPESGDHPFYFVERDEFYERSQLYGTPKGDYFDNLERFSFFCSAILPFCQNLGFQPDVIHCHDWQACLAPVYLRYRWQGAEIINQAKTVLTIHNLAYQGLFNKSKFPLLGLDA